MTLKTIDQTKAELRKELKSIRTKAFANHPNHGADLANSFPLFPKIVASKMVVAGFYPFGDEVNVLPLLKAFENNGNQICLPRIDGVKNEILFHKYSFGDALETSKYGISEPSSDAELVVPNWVFVPLLGFDKLGNRIGYGKGYYDRAIKKLRNNPNSVFIGIAFSEQEVDKIPLAPHDERLDYVIGPDGFQFVHNPQLGT